MLLMMVASCGSLVKRRSKEGERLLLLVMVAFVTHDVDQRSQLCRRVSRRVYKARGQLASLDAWLVPRMEDLGEGRQKRNEDS